MEGIDKTMPRIISGKYKGRVIQTLDGSHTRPTTDRVKESLFNILNPRLFDTSILDLFSGSGSLGLESLSRGAREVVFVENSLAARRVLEGNCRSLGVSDSVLILPMDVKQAIRHLCDKGKTFDLVFMDPPYEQGFEVPTLTALEETNLVKDGGLVMVEHAFRNQPPPSIGSFVRFDLRKYGTMAISFYRKELDQE